MSDKFTTQTVLDAVLKDRGLSSADTEMNELPARWSAAASHLSSFLQCESNPLECYTAMYEAVMKHPRIYSDRDCQCESCSERVMEFFHLGPCSHKLCKICLKKMFDQLNDECSVCKEPIRELSFCRSSSVHPPPPPAPSGSVPAPVSVTTPVCEECPVFASILKKNNLPPGTSGVVHGYKKFVQINLLEGCYISTPPAGQTLIPEENLIYLRDYMNFKFLHFFIEVDASETIFCAWTGGDATEHQLECPLREDTCKNRAQGCNFMQPYTIVAYHGINCENICLYESQPCPLCNEVVKNRDMYTHEVACSKKTIEAHKEKVKREQDAYLTGKPVSDPTSEVPKPDSPAKTTSPSNVDIQGAVSFDNRSEDDLRALTVKDVCENANVLGEVYCDFVTAARPELSSISSTVNSSVDFRSNKEALRDPVKIVKTAPTEISPKKSKQPKEAKETKRTKSPKSPKRQDIQEKNTKQKKDEKTEPGARVLSYEVCSTGSGHPFVVYKIELPSLDGGKSVIMQKRMNEIKAFHKKIQHNFPSLTLPKLPQDKPWAFGGNKLGFVEERSKLLEIYCGDINKNTMVYKSKIYKDYINEQCNYFPITYTLKE